MTGWPTLVGPRALASSLGEPGLAVVDCRHSLADPRAGAAAFDAGHVPGALHADMHRDLSGPHSAGAGRHPWPDADAFCARLAAWGITPGHQVVAYDGGDGAYAARLWFLLQTLGHAKVAVLDGGWAGWLGEGLTIETAVRAPVAAVYAGRFDSGALVDAAAVADHVRRGGLLVDARAGERFRGETEPVDRRAGHVPGATSRPYGSNLAADGRFKAPGVLAREFEALLAGRPARDLVAMCGSGVTACHHLLAMEHGGLPRGRLYAGSWSGWIEDPERPVATGD